MEEGHQIEIRKLLNVGGGESYIWISWRPLQLELESWKDDFEGLLPIPSFSVAGRLRSQIVYLPDWAGTQATCSGPAP